MKSDFKFFVLFRVGCADGEVFYIDSKTMLEILRQVTSSGDFLHFDAISYDWIRASDWDEDTLKTIQVYNRLTDLRNSDGTTLKVIINKSTIATIEEI